MAGADLDAVIRPFYRDVVGSYWPPERRHVDDGYRSLSFPFAELDAPPLEIRLDWRLEDLVGYIGTWSAVWALEQAEGPGPFATRSEEHTSELQSRLHLVCRLLLEKKK